MIKAPIFYRLKQLEASNNHLLHLYYTLNSTLDERDRNRLRNEISIRVGYRERFKFELRRCIEENFPLRNSSWGKLKESIFSRIVFFQAEVTHLFFRISWNNCYYFEIKNLRAYYDLLYSPDLKLQVSNLLLEQKRSMEGYLLCPV